LGGQATSLQVPNRDDERVFLEEFVDGGGLAEVALAGAGPRLTPTWPRARQRSRVAPQVLQFQLGGFDLTAKRDPGQGFAGLPQDVVRQRPITLPWLGGQRLALAGQVVEIAALLGFADLLFDRTFPVRQLLGNSPAVRRGRQIFLANQLASAWIASANTSIRRLSCGSVLISGGAMTIVLLMRRGRTPFWVQRATIRPVMATALS
jgi:hypothetical protein